MQVDLFPNVEFTPSIPVLRPYQANAIENIKRAVQNGKRRVLVCSPVGSGKTVLAARILSGAIGRALFVAHRGELLNQCAFQLALFGVTNIGIIKANDKRANPHAPIQVASIQTLTNRDSGTFDLVVIDEAHGGYYEELFARFPHALFIGLTATPFRLNGDGLTEYEELIIVAKPSELVRDGHICEPSMRGADTIGLSDVSFVAGEYHNGELAKKMSGPHIVGDVVDQWRKHGKGHRTVCFAVNVAHSRQIVTQFMGENVRAAHLDGNMPVDERMRILAGLEGGSIQVVSSCDVLSEGWDCLDMQTEILTPFGWKTSTDVQAGDPMYALNRETMKMEVTRIENVGVRPSKEPMFELESQHLSVRTTAKHQFHIKDPSGEWETVTGADLQSRRRIYTLPLAGEYEFFPGLPLNDDELRFIAWFMTDGGFEGERQRVVTINQSKQVYVKEIRDLLVRLGFDFRERVRQPSTHGYPTELVRHEFTIPKGTCKRRPRNGWFNRFAHILDKNCAKVLHLMTREQFIVFWSELMKGDGEQLKKSGWLWCDRKEQVDCYTHLAVTRGFATSYSERITKAGKLVYRMSVRDTPKITIAPSDPRSTRATISDPTFGEKVWCVTNALGTIVTRRKGKVAILGNCPSVKCAILARPTMSLRLHMQQGGRVLRPWQGVTPIILDHAGNLMRHGTFTEDREFTLEGGVRKERSIVLRTCKRCFLIWTGTRRTCEECGWEMPPPEERPNVQTIAGELLEHTSENASRNDFIRLAMRAKEQGFKPGFAGAKWKEKHGKWPPWAWSQQLAQTYANDSEWQERRAAREERANYWKETKHVPMATSERAAEEDNSASDYANEWDIPF